MRALIICAALLSLSCANTSFRDVTDEICIQARALRLAVEAGTALIPDEDAVFAVGLTYSVILTTCDELDAYRAEQAE